MYCPKCGSENRDDTKFCRRCGSDVSLVPEAMSGNLPHSSSLKNSKHSKKRERRRQPSLAEGISDVFKGAGFLFATLALALFAPWAKTWWFWILIPAFTLIGKGIAEIVAAKQETANRAIETRTNTSTDQVNSQDTRPILAPPAHVVDRRAPNTGELVPPPSVTEGTTRQLDPQSGKNQYE